MFEQSFVVEKQKARKPITVLASLCIQATLICISILISVAYTQSLPMAQLNALLIAPRAPVASRTPPPATKTGSAAPVRHFHLPFTAPPAIPKGIARVVNDQPSPDIATLTGPAGNPATELPFAFEPSAAPPLRDERKPAAAKPASGPVRRGGNVSAANLIYKVQPVYPPLAKQVHVQGSVEFLATIATDGRIEDLQLVRGHPLLVNAAREAVLQWRYRPTLLNGVPVEVITEITVNFTLTQP